MMLKNTSGSSASDNLNTLSFSSTQEELSDYLHSRDKDKVRKIALDHLFDLTSIDEFSPNPNRLVESRVLPIFKNPKANKKVLLINNESVGFITYLIKESFLGKDATIEHLAVDKDHQKKGYGSLLLKEALKDLKAKDADLVELQVSSMAPIPFYEKHQFAVEQYPVVKYNSAGRLTINLKDPPKSFGLKGRNLARTHRSALFAYTYVALLSLGVALVENRQKTPKTEPMP